MNITFFIVLGLAFLSFIIPAAVYGHGFTAADARRPFLPL